MLISPPFLVPRASGSAEAAWLDACMTAPASRLAGTGAPEGSFPLSHNLSWHNGMHLRAPNADAPSAAVRAVADGQVIFVHVPDKPDTNPEHAQNYNPFAPPGTNTPAWTDNGCIILEHRTTLGVQDERETELVFYSLYMHLSALGRTTPAGSTIARPLAVGDRLWRKDEVGQPGKIYGHDGQIHFEIALDTNNLRHLIHREPAWQTPQAPSADGRTDCVFGSLYVYLPANTPTVAGAQPTTHLRGSDAATTLGQPLWVKMRYGEGACQFESFDAQGQSVGRMPAQAQVEYELYREATQRHQALPAAAQASSSPSGWYELLRFGRNLGRGPGATDKDPLPDNAAHWRMIASPNGAGIWADLNTPGSFKFSDADFLPVMGWNCINDDTTPSDQRCDSPRLKTVIRDPDEANAQRMESSELAKRLGNAQVQAQLERLFCQFPVEWDQTTIDERYGYVQQLPGFKADPQAWPKLQKHMKAISFTGLPGGYLGADWHVHPKAFIRVMRECNWLSASQFKQLMPLEVVRKTSKGMIWEGVSKNAVEGQFARDHRIPLNQMLRKHLINASAERMACFFGNALQETQWLGKLHEGNQAERYAPWDGRGFLQLTWASNYLKYWDYLGRTAQIPESTRKALLEAEKQANKTRSNESSKKLDASLPAEMLEWRRQIQGDPIPRGTVCPAESAGFYWSSLGMAQYADQPHVLEKIKENGQGKQTRYYYRSPSFWRASACVNLPGAIENLYSKSLNGFEARCIPYAQSLAVLGEMTFAGADGAKLLFPDGMKPRR